jgi:hypothetical protein
MQAVVGIEGAWPPTAPDPARWLAGLGSKRLYRRICGALPIEGVSKQTSLHRGHCLELIV